MDFFHVLNRGTDKRNIVLDDFDRMRFVHSLFIFNDKNILDANHRKKGFVKSESERDLLVHIHAWCLMNNHYHLLLSPVDDDQANLSNFVKKLNGGYAKYFNEKYDRSGSLWQGKYKKIIISHDAHFMHIPYYINLNPLDYSHPKWRTGNVRNPEQALGSLKKYRWSSHLEYLEHKNFPSLLYKKSLGSVFDTSEKYLDGIYTLITSKDKDLKNYQFYEYP